MKKAIVILLTLVIASTAIFSASAAEPVAWASINGEYQPLSYGTNTLTTTASQVELGITAYSSKLGTATVTTSRPTTLQGTYTLANPITLDNASSTLYSATGTAYRLAPTIPSNSIFLSYKAYITPSTDVTSLLGTWVFDTTATLDGAAFSNGYGTFDIAGVCETGTDTFSFYRLRWSYTAQGLNLIADGDDDLFYGTELITNSSYDTVDLILTFTDAPTGEPQRLYAFLLDNATYTGGATEWQVIVNLPYSTPSSTLTTWWNTLRSNWVDSGEGLGESFTNYIITALDGFFGFEIAPGWSFGEISSILIALVLLGILLKAFFGG